MKKNEEKTAIMDSILLINGTPELRDTKDNMWRDYNIKANCNIEMYFELYQTGELKAISKYYHEYSKKDQPDVRIIDFVIDPDNLPEELLQRYPKSSLKDIANMPRCNYTRCIGLALQCHSTYRDNNGCVSKSYEHPLVMNFSNQECDDLYNIALKDPINAAIELFKRW